jgi:hypothetical protein
LFIGFTVGTYVRHGVQPVPGCWVDGRKIGDIQSGQKVLFYIADTVFHASFFISLAHVASRDGKAVVIGKVQVMCCET